LPSLWRESGKKGRNKRHYVILILTTIIAFSLLFTVKNYLKAQVPLNFFTWICAGILIALGVLVPGMSPSNFLVYLGMYKPMVDAFKEVNIFVLIPILLGGAACLFSLSANKTAPAPCTTANHTGTKSFMD
jgi:putative membrane protein